MKTIAQILFRIDNPPFQYIRFGRDSAGNSVLCKTSAHLYMLI
jgi:hypothetical protein